MTPGAATPPSEPADPAADPRRGAQWHTDAYSESSASADDAAISDQLDLESGVPERPTAESADGPAATSATDPIDAATADTTAAPVAEGTGATPAATRTRRRHHKKAPWWEIPVLLVFAIVIAALVKTFLVQPFYIPSASMEKTLHGCPGCAGDKILVNKLIYDVRDPHPGDIVVFHAPPHWNDEPASTPPSNPILRTVRGFGQLIGVVPPDGLVLVKRVIATGGQSVKGDAQGNVYVSDHGVTGPWRKLVEPFVYNDGPDPVAAFGPVTVPKGRLWVMGDHRNDSADSRYHCDVAGDGQNIGPNCDPITSTVPVSDVIGKAVLIIWPPSRWRTLGTPSTFSHDAMATPGVVPVGGAAALTLPVWLVRRRRRRA